MILLLFGQGNFSFIREKSGDYACANLVKTVLLEFRLHFLMDVLFRVFQVIPELKKNIKKGEDFVLGK